MSAPILSQNIRTGDISFWISSFSYCSHIASLVTSDATIYSASCVNSETTIDLFDCHRIGSKSFSIMLPWLRIHRLVDI
jgi:hypothetical protein